MANQFKKCSKCNIEYNQNLGSTYSIEIGKQRRIFSKNGKDFCFNCLTSEYNVNCRLCHKRINSKDELAYWGGVISVNGSYELDPNPDFFDFRCLDCGNKKFDTNRPIEDQINPKKCRIAGCSQNSYYGNLNVCKYHSKPCQGTYKGKMCEMALGSDEGVLCNFCKNQTETYQKQKDRIETQGNRESEVNEFYERKELENGSNQTNGDNLPPANPTAPNSQSITNSNNESDNSAKVNPGSSPKPSPEKDEPSKVKNNVKTIRFEKNPANPTSEKSPNKIFDNKTLIINLNNVKRIIQIAGGNLVIEFNSKKEDDYSISQTITPDQISGNQELQKVKNYLKKNNQNSLNQQELDRIFSKSNKSSTSSASTKKPQELNNTLLIGGGVMVLIIGVGIGLILRKSKKISKKVN